MIDNTIHEPEKPKPDTRYPAFRYAIARENLVLEIVSRQKQCRQQNAPLVIYGLPGTGKTTLVNLLSKQRYLDIEFPDGVIREYLNGGAETMVLKRWGAQQMGKFAATNSTISEIKNRLKRINKGRRTFVLLDDVSGPEIARSILDVLDLTTTFCVITTNHIQVAKSLSPDGSTVYTMPGFSQNEAKQFFEMNWGEKIGPEKLPLFQIIHDVLHGNPLALQFAFHLVKDGKPGDWEALANWLQNASEVELSEHQVREIYWVQQLVYERLMDEQARDCLRKLGTLPTFWGVDENTLASVWDVSAEEAHIQAKRLEEMSWLTRLVSGQKTYWQIHGQTLAFARFLIQKYPKGIANGEVWLDRAINGLSCSLRSIKIGEALQLVGKKKLSAVLPDKLKLKAPFLGQLWMGISGKQEVYWRILDSNRKLFTSDIYVDAYLLNKKEIRFLKSRNLVLGLLLVSVMALTIVDLNEMFSPALVIFISAILGVLIILWLGKVIKGYALFLERWAEVLTSWKSEDKNQA